MRRQSYSRPDEDRQMQDTGADAGPPWASIPQGNTGGLVLLTVTCSVGE